MKKSINPLVILNILNILHILNDGMLASLPLLLPFIQKDLGIEFGKIGVLTGILGLAGIALALPAASLARKYGGMRILFSAAFLYSFAFVLTGFSGYYLVLGGAFIVASIGFGLFHPISFALIAQTGSIKKTGSRMGSFTAVGDIGRVGISAFITVLVSFISWRNTTFVYAAFSFAVILALLFLGRNSDTLARSTSPDHVEIHGLHSSGRFVNALVTGFIDGLASSTIFVFIPFLFIYRGASTAVIGSMTGAFFIGNMIGKVALGKISDRIGNQKIFIVSEVIMALLLILISVTKEPMLLAGISILLGAVTKGTVPVINTLIANAIPDKRLIEKAFGISSLTTGIAASLAPVAYGFIADNYSILAVFRASAIVALCAPVPLVAQYFYSACCKKETIG